MQSSNLLRILCAVSVSCAIGFSSVCAGQVARPGAGPTFTVADRDLPRNLNLIAYGDMRFTDPANVVAANPSARKALVARIASERPDALLLSGDVPYAGNNPGDYAEYALETASWRAAKLRVYPALGNHELVGQDKEEDVERWWGAFPALKGMRWYSVQLGKRVLLLNLDSNSDLTPGSPQRAWIEAQVKSLPRSVDFVFIGLHHPPVADVQTRIEVSHNPRPNEISLRDYLSIAAKTSHARFIVAAGHIHNYERFDKDGVVYLVSGGGGAAPYPVERTPPDLYQDNAFPNFHYVKFSLDGKDLKATMYRLADATAAEPVWQTKDSFIIHAK